MKLQCTALDWDTHHETVYSLLLDESQIASLAAGSVPSVVKAMCEDVLHFRDQDEARAAANEQAAKRKRKKSA